MKYLFLLLRKKNVLAPTEEARNKRKVVKVVLKDFSEGRLCIYCSVLEVAGGRKEKQHAQI